MYTEIRDEAGDLVAIPRASDAASIPIDEEHGDYREYLAWVADHRA